MIENAAAHVNLDVRMVTTSQTNLPVLPGLHSPHRMSLSGREPILRPSACGTWGRMGVCVVAERVRGNR